METLKRMVCVHPIYYAMAPLSMLFRTVHCLPILLQAKPNTDASNPYNKYTERCRPPDVTFHADNYGSFQFVQYRFRRAGFLDSLPGKLEEWSQRHFGIQVNLETSRGSARSFVSQIVKTRPSQRIANTTHLFVLLPDTNEFIGLLDHYYCDGLILFDFFTRVFDEISTLKLPFPTYRYYPLVSDALACELTTRVLYDTLRYPSCITRWGKSRIFRRVVRRCDSPDWNRWSNYATHVLSVFECTDGLPYVRVAVTVGISTDSTFGNNRIGAIIVRIVRPPNTLTTPQTKLACLMTQFEASVTQHYTDAVVSYDVLRSYDTSMLRTFGTSDVLDIVFTSMCFRTKLDAFHSGLGAFIGNVRGHTYLYINTMTVGDVTHASITTNWEQFDHFKYVSDFGAKLMYAFD